MILFLIWCESLKEQCGAKKEKKIWLPRLCEFVKRFCVCEISECLSQTWQLWVIHVIRYLFFSLFHCPGGVGYSPIWVSLPGTVWSRIRFITFPSLGVTRSRVLAWLLGWRAFFPAVNGWRFLVILLFSRYFHCLISHKFCDQDASWQPCPFLEHLLLLCIQTTIISHNYYFLETIPFSRTRKWERAYRRDCRDLFWH